MTIETNSIHRLVKNCSSEGVSPQQFLNFYHEFINEHYGASFNTGDDAKDEENSKLVLSDISAQLLIAFQDCSNDVLLSEYLLHLLFIHYDSRLLSILLPKMYAGTIPGVLTHFHTHAAFFISKLSDKLIREQMLLDVPKVLIPSCLQSDFNSFDEQLFISVVKYLQALLSMVQKPIEINFSKELLSEKSIIIITRLHKSNKILAKKMALELENKLKLSSSTNLQLVASPQACLPSFTSKFTSTPGSAKPLGNITSATINDLKLIKFYKNLWLNNKIHNYTTTDPQFLEKFSSINGKLCSTSQESFPLQKKISDLIETTYTSFAQLVNNKLYHQNNTNFTLLERKYIHFITKRLPLIIKDSIPHSPSIVLNSLENIDNKVKKAIRSYYSNKNDSSDTNEDLFDDFSTNNFDIRHDFLKNLIMLKLQPPSALNEFLRDDQMVDTKTLQTDDTLTISNSQGVQERVLDIPSTLHSLLNDLEIENQYVANGSHYSFSSENPLIQMLNSFDEVPATKQVELSLEVVHLLENSCASSDYKQLGKLLWILVSNFGHSTTTMLCCISPDDFLKPVIAFLEKKDTDSSHKASDESDLDKFNISVTFAYAISFVLFMKETYSITIEKYIPNFNDSYILSFIKSLKVIPENFFLPGASEDQSNNYLKNWLKDLFINGSISDSQMRTASVKDLIELVPFIFKQSVMALQAGAVSNIFTLTSGLEYFLQPFLLPGLIKVMFSLDQHLLAIKNSNPPPQLLSACWDMLSTIICPPSLDDDAKGLHFVILKLNCIKILNALQLFRNDENSNNQYGVYASQESNDPKLEGLITKLEYVAVMSQLYDIDPRLYSTTKEGYSHAATFSSKIPITSEVPVDKIMGNQFNSFWNLHSSTYYNYDYLMELVKIVTPEKFFLASVRTLSYKVSAYGIPGSQSKTESSSLEHVANFLVYFMILHDLNSENQRLSLISYIETGQLNQPDVHIKPDAETKIDEDFDMLFGEPFSNALEETSVVFSQSETNNEGMASLTNNISASFGLVIARINDMYTKSLTEGLLTEEEYKNATLFTRKYIENLKNSVV